MISFNLNDLMIQVLRDEGLVVKSPSEFVQRGFILPNGEFLINETETHHRKGKDGQITSKTSYTNHMHNSHKVYDILVKAGLLDNNLKKDSYHVYSKMVDIDELINTLYDYVHIYNTRKDMILLIINFYNKNICDKTLDRHECIHGTNIRYDKFFKSIENDFEHLFDENEYYKVIRDLISKLLKKLIYYINETVEEFRDYFDLNSIEHIHNLMSLCKDMINMLQVLQYETIIPKLVYEMELGDLCRNALEEIAIKHIAQDSNFFLDNCNAIRLNGCNENYILLPKDMINEAQLASLRRWVEDFFLEGKKLLQIEYYGLTPYLHSTVFIYTRDMFDEDISNKFKFRKFTRKITTWYLNMDVELKPSDDGVIYDSTVHDQNPMHYRHSDDIEKIKYKRTKRDDFYNEVPDPFDIVDFIEESVKKKRKKTKTIKKKLLINDDVIDEFLYRYM